MSPVENLCQRLEQRTLLSAGNLDKSFGSSGIFIDGTPSVFHDVIPLKSGKLLAAGSIGASPYRDFLLTRLNANGTIDRSFGRNGIVRTNFGGDDAVTVAQQGPGDTIVLVGWTGTKQNFTIARYHLDGRLDKSFSGDGKLTLPMGIGYDQY